MATEEQLGSSWGLGLVLFFCCCDLFLLVPSGLMKLLLTFDSKQVNVDTRVSLL